MEFKTRRGKIRVMQDVMSGTIVYGHHDTMLSVNSALEETL